MELVLEQKFIDFDGQIIEDKPGEGFTLKKAMIRSLITPFPDEQSLTGEEKFARGELASRINQATTITLDFKAEDIVLIKKLIAKAYTVQIVWQAWKMLEEMKTP